MTITYEQGPGLGYIIVYFIVCKTTSELEHTILITLYLVGVKNIDNLHAMNKDLQCVFSSGRFDGSLISARYLRRW
jgi:hypothetical protein